MPALANAKHEAFCAEYLRDFDAGAAYERLGWGVVSVPPAEGFYTYLLIDPRNGRVFYVGKGRGARMYQHFRCWKGGAEKNVAKARAFDSIGAECAYIVFSVHGADEAAAYAAERQMIAALKGSGLSNATDGTTSEDERAVYTAECLLQRIKPLDVWLAERPRTAGEIEMYRLVREGLQRFATGEDTDHTATLRVAR